jgi:hypothetical protein
MIKPYTLRTNNLGHNYRLVQDGPNVCTIVNETLGKKIVVNHHKGDIDRGWYAWRDERKLIQEAFPFLSADEREFIKTGITSSEWNEMFLNDADQYEEE